jgi:hypothetical protein
MTSEKTADTNPERADENAGGRTSEKLPFEIPECCRHMMTQMMGGSFCDLAKSGEERSAHSGSTSPGILGRLMLRMMKACCGRLAAKQNRAV